MKIRMYRHVLEGVLAQLTNHPEQFDWSEWVSNNGCGTHACIAGWIALLNCTQADEYIDNKFISPISGTVHSARDVAPHVLVPDWNELQYTEQSDVQHFLSEFLFVPGWGHWDTDFPTLASPPDLWENSRQDALRRIKWILDGHRPIHYVAPGKSISSSLTNTFGDIEIELV